MEEIIQRLTYLEYQIKKEHEENIHLKDYCQQLELKLNKIENVQAMTTMRLEYSQQENQLLKEQLRLIAKRMTSENTDYDLMLGSTDETEKQLVGLILTNESNIEYNCIDLLIEEIKSNYSFVYLQSLKNLICRKPEMLLKEFEKDIFDIILDKLKGNVMEKECCIEILLTMTALLNIIPNEIVEELTNTFSDEILLPQLKVDILFIFTTLENDQMKYLIKIIHKIVLFSLNPLFLKKENYGIALIVISNILPMVSEEVLMLLCRDIVKLDIWKVDYGEQWRMKHKIDPQSLITTLLEHKSVVELLETSSINNISYLDYIINNLELCSNESLQVVYELCNIIPNHCFEFIDELLEIYPFNGDIISMESCCDIFYIFLKLSDTKYYHQYKEKIITCIKQYIPLKETIFTEKLQKIEDLIIN